MFQFPAFASRFSVMSPEPVTGFPIRISADQVVFADPRGFSQLITSFFASGSHRHPPCALLRFPFVLHNGYATPAPLLAQARISIIQSFAFLITLESLAAALLPQRLVSKFSLRFQYVNVLLFICGE